MVPFDAGERTEAATPRKREEARERGQVARSQDLTAALVLLAAFAGLHFFGLPALGKVGRAVARGLKDLGSFPSVAETGAARRALLLSAETSVEVLLPTMAMVFLAGIIANTVQVGFLWNVQRIALDPGRLNPVRGLARVLSVRGLSRGAWAVLKLAAVGLVLVSSLWSELGERGSAMALGGSTAEACALAWGAAVGVGLKASGVLLVLGILDYGLECWLHQRDLRMTQREVREEHRRLEGDPQVKERRRRRRYELARSGLGPVRRTARELEPSSIEPGEGR